MAGTLRAFLTPPILALSVWFSKLDKSSGPLLVLFWTHPCTPESSPLRLAIFKSPRRFGHLAFSPLNPSNICDCSPWSLEIMRLPRSVLTKILSARLLRINNAGHSRGPQDNGKMPIRLAKHTRIRIKSGCMAQAGTGRAVLFESV
jgi:hypothetical protein